MILYQQTKNGGDMANKIVLNLTFLMLFLSPLIADEKPFSKDIYEISSTLQKIITNYTNMDFEKILPFTEGKAKKDIEKTIFDTKNPTKYQQIKQEISLLSEPTIKEIKVFDEESLALATVEWKYKRSIPKGNSFEYINVSREINYLFKKFGNAWKLISYR